MRQRSLDLRLATLLLVALAVGVGGCASRVKEPAAPVASSPADTLLSRAQQLAAEGHSLRAEQYYLAAMEAGVDPAVVFPLLIETCIESGRLGSALHHVESRLLEKPHSRALRELARALRETLGVAREESLSGAREGGA